jgi:hypothetical protein
MEDVLEVDLCLLISTGPYAGGLPLTADLVLTERNPLDWSEPRGCGVKLSWPCARHKEFEACLMNALHELDLAWDRVIRADAEKVKNA